MVHSTDSCVTRDQSRALDHLPNDLRDSLDGSDALDAILTSACRRPIDLRISRLSSSPPIARVAPFRGSLQGATEPKVLPYSYGVLTTTGLDRATVGYGRFLPRRR
jgi:hypothetical protein